MFQERLMHKQVETSFPEEIAHFAQRSESARGSSAVGTPSPRQDDLEVEAQEDDENEDSDDCNKQTGGKSSRPRKPHLQGRFSGRLETKQDEKRLAEECKLLGPMLGGTGKRGEKSRLTLAKIVRGIASGDVRKYCLSRERKVQELSAQLERLKARDAQLGRPELPPISSTSLKEEPSCVLPTGPLGLTVLPSTVASSQAATQNYPEASASLQIASSVPIAEPVQGALSLTPPATTVPQTAEVQVLAHGAVQLKAQAQNFQAHAVQLHHQSQQLPCQPESVQVAVQAKSFQAKAQSLEKAAQAQNLQAQAVVHAQAQAQAQAQAHHLVAQAHDHAQAYAHAAAQADHLKKVSSIGSAEIYEAHEVVAAQAQHLEHEAHSHAQAQTKLTVQAHNLAAKAQAHAHAQAQAQAQAQQAAVEAHQLDAAAQQLQAEAQAVASPLPVLSTPQEKASIGLEHVLSSRALTSQSLPAHSEHSGAPLTLSHPSFPGIDIHSTGGVQGSQALEGPVISLQSTRDESQARLQS